MREGGKGIECLLECLLVSLLVLEYVRKRKLSSLLTLTFILTLSMEEFRPQNDALATRNREKGAYEASAA